jgi:hypothetical protein
MRLDTVTYGPHPKFNYYISYYWESTSLAYGNILDDADDSCGMQWQFQKTGTISGIGFYLTDVQGNPDYAFTFVTISGTPTASLDPKPQLTPSTKVAEHYSNADWQNFHPDVDGVGWTWHDLNTQVNVTKGDFAAFVITPSGAVTPNASNKIRVNDESPFGNQAGGNYWYYTSWGRDDWEPPAGLKYTDGTIQGFCITSPKWEEYVSPVEWGLEFQLPVGATCVGAVFGQYPVDTYPDNSPFKVILADSSDSELASATVDDLDLFGAIDGSNIRLGWDTTTDPVLAADTSYRLYIKPTSSEPVNKWGFQLESEAAKASLPGGTNWKWIERPAPASGWTYKADHYPLISLELVDLQGGTGGSPGGGGEGGAAFGFIS